MQKTNVQDINNLMNLTYSIAARAAVLYKGGKADQAEDEAKILMIQSAISKIGQSLIQVPEEEIKYYCSVIKNSQKTWRIWRKVTSFFRSYFDKGNQYEKGLRELNKFKDIETIMSVRNSIAPQLQGDNMTAQTMTDLKHNEAKATVMGESSEANIPQEASKSENQIKKMVWMWHKREWIIERWELIKADLKGFANKMKTVTDIFNANQINYGRAILTDDPGYQEKANEYIESMAHMEILQGHDVELETLRKTYVGDRGSMFRNPRFEKQFMSQYKTAQYHQKNNQ